MTHLPASPTLQLLCSDPISLQTSVNLKFRSEIPQIIFPNFILLSDLMPIWSDEIIDYINFCKAYELTYLFEKKIK